MSGDIMNTYVGNQRRAAAGEDAPWKIGTVTSVEPLVVSYAGLPFEGTELLVNPQLLQHTRRIRLSGLQGELLGNPQVQVASGDLECEVEFEPLLQAGDRVLIMSWKGDQEFAVVCKLV